MEFPFFEIDKAFWSMVESSRVKDKVILEFLFFYPRDDRAGRRNAGIGYKDGHGAEWLQVASVFRLTLVVGGLNAGRRLDMEWRHCVYLSVLKRPRIFPGALMLVLFASLFVTGCGSSTDASSVNVGVPTFSLASGAYSSAQIVTISSSTPGATIYYTCYGPGLGTPCVDSNPTTAVLPPPQTGAFLGTPYTGPIAVSGTETISAIATYVNAPFSAAASASYTLPLPAPTFSLAGGAYTSFQTLTLADAVPNASIYYTTDGTTPTTASTLFAATKPISVSMSETVNAIAVDANYANSGVSTAAYAINLGTAAAPTVSPASGTYTSIQTVSMTDATPGVAINYSVNGGVPVLYTAPFQVSASSTIVATAALTGYFLTSPATNVSYTINLPPAPTPTFTPVAGTYTSIQSVAIADTVAGASIYYTTNGSAPTTTQTATNLLYTGPITVSATETINAIAINITGGYSQSAVGTAAYTINLPPAATPTFTLPAGTYTTSPQSVSILDTTAGASIYYTVNGATPTPAPSATNFLYTAGATISVSQTETIKAIAVATGYSNSAVGSAAYVLNLPPSLPPTFSPGAGTYSSPQTVAISSTQAGSIIYYTLDGSAPSTLSSVYSAPIAVAQQETINAIAVAPNYSPSPAAAALYTITYPLTGVVMSGTTPVSGAIVTMYTAGTGGYGLGSAAVSTPATTDANGKFTVNYFCPSSSSQIYLVSDGGNPGLASGTSNPSMAMMAALGTCKTLTATPASTVTINEVTTVSSVWALQQFMASPTVDTTQGVPMIGTSAATYNGVQTGIIGLQNAFAMVNNMVNVATGSAATPPNTWSTPETTKINSIADMLVTCDSTNPTTSTGCSTLMSAATPPGKTKALDTIQAAWYIAQNPANNVSALYKLIPTTPTPPFAGVTAAPNDFTIAVNLAPTYTPATTALYAVNVPHHIAFDRYGNAWLSNNGSISNTLAAPAGVVELAPNGSVLMNPVSSFTASTTGGSYSQFTTVPKSNTISYSKPRMVAIDANNNVWVANYGSSTGTPAAGTIGYVSGSTAAGVAGGTTLSGYYVGGSPWGLAIDGHNNVYESNTATVGIDPLSIGRLAAGNAAYTYSTSAGSTPPNQIPSLVFATGTNGSSVTFPAALAVDTNTTVSGSADGLLWLASAACVVGSSQYNNGVPVPWGVVDIFAADTVSALGASEATTSYSGATLGAGSTTNCGTTTNPGSGLQIGQVFSAAMANPYGVAVDRYNGVWIADDYYSSGTTFNVQGFNGLTYLTAPTANTGVIPNSTHIVSGPALAPTGTPQQGQIERVPTYIEVDGNNNVWVANNSFNVVAEASVTQGTSPAITYLTPASVGFLHTNLSSASGLAIDPSGNVWVTNTSSSSTYPGQANGPATPYVGSSVTVLVGAAAPVVTPLAQAVQSNMLGQKP